MPVPDSEAVRVLRDFRLRMDAEDLRLMEDLGNRWLGIERSLQSEIGALAEEMARRTAAGEQITQQMIWKAERYQVIQAQLETEVKKYNKDYAVGRIADAQETAAALGVDAAQASIFASYPSPLSANFNRVNVAAVESLAGFAGDGTPLRRLLDQAVGDASDGIVSAMLAGLGSGQGALAIAKNMADGMGLGLDRSVLIARTETQRAYRSGTVQQYRESGVVSGFMRLVKKDGACIGCLALDGELFELEEELDDHPNGRCTAVPIVRGMEPPTWEKGEDWLANQDEAKQREILGPARFEMYANGTPLSAFSTKTHNDVWGSAPQIVTLKDLANKQDIISVLKGDNINKIVESYADSIRNADVEKRYIIDSRDGSVISSGTGTAQRVTVEDTSHVVAPRHTVIDIHNHPDGTPPSDEDWKQLGWSSVKEIRVVTKAEDFIIAPPNNLHITPRQIKEAWDVIENHYFEKIYKSGDEAYDTILYINKEMAKKTGISFKRISR